MTKVESTLDLLTKSVIEGKLRGHTFEEIAEDEGITVEDCVAAWKSYVDQRMVMSEEEQWLLHFMRLERLLTRANAMLEASTDIKGVEQVLGVLDRIEGLQALNKARKQDAEDALVRMTEAQTAIILHAFAAMQSSLRRRIDEAFSAGKTIKQIRGTVLDVVDNGLLPVAQEALTGAGSEDQ